MVKNKLPINEEILKWARISIGMSLEEVAQNMGGSFRAETIQKWEEGIGSPTYPQLEKIAQDIEIICNRFANSFLVPDREV